MSRKPSDIQNPAPILFKASLNEKEHLREYCFRKRISFQEAMRESLVDYLVKVGEVESREALQREEEVG